MNIVIMLILIILGWAAGEHFNWLLGLPLMCGGLYVGGLMGSPAWRFRQENAWTFLGLVSIVIVFLGAIFNW